MSYANSVSYEGKIVSVVDNETSQFVKLRANGALRIEKVFIKNDATFETVNEDGYSISVKEELPKLKKGDKICVFGKIDGGTIICDWYWRYP